MLCNFAFKHKIFSEITNLTLMPTKFWNLVNRSDAPLVAKYREFNCWMVSTDFGCLLLMMKFEVGLDNLPIVESSRGKLNSSSFERYPLTHPCPTKAETTGILEKTKPKHQTSFKMSNHLDGLDAILGHRGHNDVHQQRMAAKEFLHITY